MENRIDTQSVYDYETMPIAGTDRRCIQGGPKKVSHYQMIKKSYYIVLKPVNEIRFIIKIKCESSTIILFVGIRYSMRDLLSDLNNHS